MIYETYDENDKGYKIITIKLLNNVYKELELHSKRDKVSIDDIINCYLSTELCVLAEIGRRIASCKEQEKIKKKYQKT